MKKRRMVFVAAKSLVPYRQCSAHEVTFCDAVGADARVNPELEKLVRQVVSRLEER